VLVRVWFARKYHTVLSEKTRRRLLPKIALALFMVLFPLVITEYALAFAGVPAGEPVFVMHGQKGEAIRADGSMVNDADLLWRFEPGKEFNGRIVNAMGFLDRDVSEVKSQGVTRVICLGDSCSAQGVPPYSGHLNEMLKEQSPDETSWEAFNTAVHGYTVLQGLALYRTRVAVMSPDIVTIYFGWNDHWLAAEDDAERLARVGTPWITAMRNALVQKRMVALLAPRVNREKPDFTLRVPPDVYAGGLRDLIHAIRASGAEPLVLTAPRARTVHGHLVNAGHARSVEEALRLHDEYTDITRRIAREENTLLFDLAVAIKNPEFFSSDGIHFTDDGIREVARLIHGELMAWK
jgi:lysophospholipase L1-like esterase